MFTKNENMSYAELETFVQSLRAKVNDKTKFDLAVNRLKKRGLYIPATMLLFAGKDDVSYLADALISLAQNKLLTADTRKILIHCGSGFWCKGAADVLITLARFNNLNERTQEYF